MAVWSELASRNEGSIHIAILTNVLLPSTGSASRNVQMALWTSFTLEKGIWDQMAAATIGQCSMTFFSSSMKSSELRPLSSLIVNMSAIFSGELWPHTMWTLKLRLASSSVRGDS